MIWSKSRIRIIGLQKYKKILFMHSIPKKNVCFKKRSISLHPFSTHRRPGSNREQGGLKFKRQTDSEHIGGCEKTAR
jgi:hypothetical protein